MQDPDPSDISTKNFSNPLKRIRVITRTPTHGRTDRQTDRRTDGRTDGRTDEQGESSIPPLNFVSGGIIISTLHMPNFLEGRETYIYILSFFHIDMTGSWNPSSSKTGTYLFYIADVMVTQGARASATMIFTLLKQINSETLPYEIT